MKSLICSIILLSSIICATVTVGIYTDNQLASFIDSIEQKIPSKETATFQSAEEIEREFEKMKPYLILFMQKNEVRDIEMHIADMKSAVESDDEPNILAAKSRLILHIRQLRRLSTFSIEAIF